MTKEDKAVRKVQTRSVRSDASEPSNPSTLLSRRLGGLFQWSNSFPVAIAEVSHPIPSNSAVKPSSADRWYYRVALWKSRTLPDLIESPNFEEVAGLFFNLLSKSAVC